MESIKTIVGMPCTARNLENALHRLCDEHGLWDATVEICLHKPANVYVLELHTGEADDAQGAP